MTEATSRSVALAPGAATLAALSLPSVLFAGFDLARRFYLPLFLTSDVGSSMAEAAVLVALTGAWGVLIEFAMSAVGDSTFGRYSPRVFWTVSGTALIIAATLALQPVSGAPNLASVALVMAAMITGWTLCNVTHGAWALETGRTAAARSAIFGMRGFAAIAGTVSFALLAATINSGDVGPSMPSPFVVIVIVTGCGIPVLHGWLIVQLGRHPGLPWRRWSAGSVIAPVRAVLSDAGASRLALLYGLVGLNGGVGASTFLIMARAGLGLQAWADLILGLYTAAAAIGALASARWGAVWRSERLLTVLMLGKVGFGAGLLALPPGRPELLAIWAMASGAIASFGLLALRLLLGEALDRAEAKTGRSQGAMFYAAFHIPLNIGLAAGGALALAAMGWAGIDPNADRFEQSNYTAVEIPALGLAVTALMAVFALRGISKKYNFTV